MWAGIISGLFGGATGLVQGVIERKQSHKLEIEKLKVQEQTRLQIAELESRERQANVDIEKENTQQISLQAEIQKMISSQEKYQTYTNTINEINANDELVDSGSLLINLANVWRAITRPNISYLLIIAYIVTRNELLLIPLEYVLGFWFVSRSAEKGYSKKKS